MLLLNWPSVEDLITSFGLQMTSGMNDFFKISSLHFGLKNAKIGKPATILAAYICTFSNLSVSKIEQPFQTAEACSNNGLTKVT